MATDTMDGKFSSIHGHLYYQVFGDKYFFIEAYSIHKKSDCGSDLEKFVQYYGAPDFMIHDGSKVQYQPGTEFQKIMRKYDNKNKAYEPESNNHNTSKGVI